MRERGFGSRDEELLLIEYAIDGMGTAEDLDKRHRLEERMNETLGWTGLGSFDGAILAFFLKAFRDEYCEVNHLSLEGEVKGNKHDFTIVLKN